MTSFLTLFSLFFLVTIAELYLFLRVGSVLGIGRTLILVILTAFVGASLVRRQGFQVLQRAQANLRRGVPPAAELVDGLLIGAAGLLLLTPGFFTDGVGFSFLFPPIRAAIRQGLKRRLKESAGWDQPTSPFSRPEPPPRASDIEIIDETPADPEAQDEP